jgi:hypothetical protein
MPSARRKSARLSLTASAVVLRDGEIQVGVLALDAGNLLAHAFRDLDSVAIAGLLDDQRDILLAVDAGDVRALHHAVAHRRDILEADDAPARHRVAVVGQVDLQFAQFVHRLELAQQAHIVVAVAFRDAPCGHIQVRALQRAHNRVDRQPVGVQSLLVDQHLDFALLAAANRDARHAGHAGESVFDDILCQVAQLVGRAVARQREIHRRLRLRIQLEDGGSLRAFGQLVQNRVQLRLYFQISVGEVCADVELQRHLRHPELRGGGDLTQPLCPRNRVLYRFRDEGFNLFGRGARVDRYDGDVRKVHLRLQLDLHAPQRVVAQHENGDHEHHDGDGSVQSQSGHPHGSASLLLQDAHRLPVAE